MPATIDRRPGASTDSEGLMLYAVGWKDNLASFLTGKVAGANVPSFSTLLDGLSGYEFTASQLKEIWVSFHIGHDYAPGTLQYPHVHFSPDSDEVAGVVRWGVEYTIANSAGGVFPASRTVYIETDVPASSKSAHIIGEVSDGDAISGDGLLPDAVLMCRYFRDGAHANDTYAGSVIGIYGDLHYQSDRDTTVNRIADFYE